MLTSESHQRRTYESFTSPDEVPEFELVPLRAPSGDYLTDYSGVARKDNQEVVSVVSSRYGLVGHREVARVVHQVAETLEVPLQGEAPSPFPREQIRLYSNGRRMEHRLVIGGSSSSAKGSPSTRRSGSSTAWIRPPRSWCPVSRSGSHA